MNDLCDPWVRVLVIDDEPDFRDLAVRMVQDEGAQSVRSVDSADAASVELYWRDYDVILTDLRMPGRSGVELIESVRRRRGVKVNKNVGIVAVSGEADPRLVRRVKEAGADSYLLKPVDSRSLASRVMHAAKAARARRGQANRATSDAVIYL